MQKTLSKPERSSPPYDFFGFMADNFFLEQLWHQYNNSLKL